MDLGKEFMKKEFSANLERRIKTNGWIIKIRWIYMAGIFSISLLTKFMGHDQLEISLASIFLLFAALAMVNLFLHFAQKAMENNFSGALLVGISYAQIIVELIFFTIMTYFFGGIESISTAYFFLPVVSASLIFGAKGSIMTAIIASVLINSLMVEEYFGMASHTSSSTGLLGIEFHREHITAIKTITSSIFYIIVGLFSGYSADMLLRREESVEEKVQQLDKQTKRLEEERNKTFSIIANFTDPIIVLDEADRISVINPAACRVFELTDQDLGKSVAMDNKFSMANFTKIAKKGFRINQTTENADDQDFAQEEIYLAENGQESVYKVITAKVLSGAGQRLGTMKIFYDLTREKTIDRMKSEFISVAAHQLRTPLSAIKWVVNLILQGDAGRLNREQKEMLNKGYLSNERMIRLVDDLLNVARLEEGKFGFDFKKVDFEEVLNASLANVEALAAKNKQQFTVNQPEKLPEVYMDKGKIIMVMQNLLANAIKYSPPNSKIEVEIAADNKNIEVKIIDHGVGIPQKDQPKIFSKFFRAANVVKMETEGTGLGLFIVKNIIEKHNGRIALTSKEGEGTKVTFSMPIDKSAGSLNI